MAVFGDFYRGKRVMVTGHTGFKGSWLALWLQELGATVIGYSLEPPTNPSHFTACGMSQQLHDLRADILDYDSLLAATRRWRPEIIFHLAAQPIVRQAYQDPRHTFHVNVMGTANLLEAARQTDSVSLVIVVTSDKVYRNAEWEWAYRETDPLGGYEPYGASKACAELIVNVYQDRRFQRAAASPNQRSIASVRAGNVIGGGDWAKDRIVPDLVRSISSGTELIIRHPEATRPWQHVLDALSGYLCLGPALARAPDRFGTAWNFGPLEQKSLPVEQLARAFLKRWPASESILRIERGAIGEHSALRVDSSKARELLKWQPAWGIEQVLDATVDWYQSFYRRTGEDACQKSREQIADYCQAATTTGIAWAVQSGTGN